MSISCSQGIKMIAPRTAFVVKVIIRHSRHLPSSSHCGRLVDQIRRETDGQPQMKGVRRRRSASTNGMTGSEIIKTFGTPSDSASCHQQRDCGFCGTCRRRRRRSDSNYIPKIKHEGTSQSQDSERWERIAACRISDQSDNPTVLQSDSNHKIKPHEF